MAANFSRKVRIVRIRTLIGLVVVAAIGVVAVGGILVARAHAGRPTVESVSPAPSTVVNGETPIRVILRSPDDANNVTITVDGDDVTATAQRTPNGYELAMPKLVDGEHTVTVSLDDTTLLGEPSTYRWSFRSDATAPPVAVTTPESWSEKAEISGTTEPAATVTVEWGNGRAYATADGAGRFRLLPAVDEGETDITVSATDQAGNTARTTHTMRVDTSSPAVRFGGVGEWVTDTDRPELYAFVDDASPTKVEATINGQEAKATPMSIGYVVETGALPQGTSTLSLTVTDTLGRTTTRTTSFGVDTTEKLTNNLTLAPGARGNDVARLTKRLKVERVWEGKPSWTYDAKVEQAVRTFQRKVGLPVDGIARPALLDRTVGRIVVIKSKHVLNLWLDGKLVKQYKIAVGMPAYPTPTGSFVVTEKIVNPTWTPPNSPWAAGLEPVPPGAGNPLGTRWIGTSAFLVGIHGTPEVSSIGTDASHGCIRMLIPEVEELFERVTVGMPVEFKD